MNDGQQKTRKDVPRHNQCHHLRPACLLVMCWNGFLCVNQHRPATVKQRRRPLNSKNNNPILSPDCITPFGAHSGFSSDARRKHLLKGMERTTRRLEGFPRTQLRPPEKVM